MRSHNIIYNQTLGKPRGQSYAEGVPKDRVNETPTYVESKDSSINISEMIGVKGIVLLLCTACAIAKSKSVSIFCITDTDMECNYVLCIAWQVQNRCPLFLGSHRHHALFILSVCIIYQTFKYIFVIYCFLYTTLSQMFYISPNVNTVVIIFFFFIRNTGYILKLSIYSKGKKNLKA